MFSISIGLLEGSYGDIIDLFTSDHTGHIQIHKKGYIDRPTIYNAIDNEIVLRKKISACPEVKAQTPRVYSSALAFHQNKTAVVRIIGIDPVKEGAAMRLPDMVQEGRFLSESPSHDIIIGGGTADVLQVAVGDEIAILGQGADGSNAPGSFRIIGIMGKRNDSYNRTNCYLHISQAQQLLALDGRVHEIAIMIKDQGTSIKTAAKLTQILDDRDLDVSPWQVVEKQFYVAMQADTKITYSMQLIIMVIVAIGVLNTVLMAIMERIPEFGVLRALGTRPTGVFKLIMLETALLSLMSIFIGSLCSWGLNAYLSLHGISFPPIEWAGFVFETIASTVTFKTFWLPGVVTLFSALFVSIFPALKAARITPVKAIKFQ